MKQIKPEEDINCDDVGLLINTAHEEITDFEGILLLPVIRQLIVICIPIYDF
jgi:hypothetical protein